MKNYCYLLANERYYKYYFEKSNQLLCNIKCYIECI